MLGMSSTVSIRFEDEYFARFDKIAEVLSAQVAGVKITRVDAIKAVTEHGLMALEKKLGLAK